MRQLLARHIALSVLAFAVCAVISAQTDIASQVTDSIKIANNEETEWQYKLPHAVYEAISTQNTTVLTSHLNTQVEVAMPQTDSHIYSKKQAEVVIKDFFGSLQDIEFNISHERSVGISTLTIGILSSHGKSYRVFIKTQSNEHSLIIQQFKVENIFNK